MIYNSFQNIQNLRPICHLFIAAIVVFLTIAGINGQSSTPKPTPDETLYNGYRVSSTTEFDDEQRLPIHQTAD